jgi:hypothetical protein
MLPVLTVILLVIFVSMPALCQSGSALQAGGYTEAMPIFISFGLPDGEQVEYLEYRLQNRLNLRWFATTGISVTWEMRTRFFAGDLVQEIPGYARAIDTDDGLVKLSGIVAESDSWFLHYNTDRFYTEWADDSWSIRAGRQRLNWGINTITNPNDLFNIYSFYDFAYPERPGADAVRLQHFTGYASRIEVAVSPSRHARRHITAILWQFNRSEYDIQFIAGYYRHRAALGAGWAGSISQTGFKGEVTYFHDIDDRISGRNNDLVAAISADHMFGSGIFIVAEILWNSSGGREEFSLIGTPLSADNPSFSRYQLTLQAGRAFSPLVSGNMLIAGYPDEEAVFLSPSVTWSVNENLDLTVLSQYIVAGSRSNFADAGYVLAGSLRWSF